MSSQRRAPPLTLGGVFTDSGPATHSRVERPVEDALALRCLRTRGCHLVLVGDRLVGKTTVGLAAISATERPYIRVSARRADSLDQICARALREFAFLDRESGVELRERDVSVSVSLLGTGIRAGRKTVWPGAVPDDADPVQRVLHLMLRLGAVIELSEVQRLSQQSRSALCELMKEVSDRSLESPDARFVVSFSDAGLPGALWIERELVGRVMAVLVPRLTVNQAEGVLKRGGAALNVDFDPQIPSLLALLAAGDVRVLQRLAFTLCEAAGIHGRQPTLRHFGLQEAQRLLAKADASNWTDYETRMLRVFTGEQPASDLVRELQESARRFVDEQAVALFERAGTPPDVVLLADALDALERAGSIMGWLEAQLPSVAEDEAHIALRRRLGARADEVRHQMTEDRTGI